MSATAPLRHSVLVTQPISDAARRRLDVFFEVQTLWEDRLPTRDQLVDSLQGKAGVLTDGRLDFDAALIDRLPLLRAVCHTGPGPHRFELPACTRAGIRATSLPDPCAARLRVDALAQRVWEELLPRLQQAAPAAGAQGRYGRWSRAGLMAAAPQSTLALLGDSPLAAALAALAGAARVRVLHADGSASAAQRQATWEDADLVVLCPPLDDAAKAPAPVARAADLARLRPGARVFNLAGPQALAGEVLADAALLARVDDARSLVGQVPAQEPSDRSRLAAEDLVAALGFGRHGWHPPNLLNTEILCESCC